MRIRALLGRIASVVLMCCALRASTARTVEPIRSVAGFDILPFVLQSRIFVPLGSTRDWGRGVDRWRCVRPHWIVGLLDERPILTQLPIEPGTLDEGRTVGLVAINTKSGQTKWLRLPREMDVASTVTLGLNKCGVVVRERRAKPDSGDWQLHSWDLAEDEVGPGRRWDPLLAPIANAVDLDRVSLSRDLTSLTVSIDIREGGQKVAVPAPLKEYSTPLEMTAIWEHGDETRWYAPTADRIGLVVFRGQHVGAFGPVSLESAITCYDPRVENGVRWNVKLSAFVEDGANLVLPIAFDWSEQSSLYVQVAGVAKAGKKVTRDERIDIFEITLRDGNVEKLADFQRPMFRVHGWPHCSGNDKRLPFIVDELEGPCTLRVFDLGSKQFLQQLNLASLPELVAILPTGEAIIQDPWRLWAVQTSDRDYGKGRDIRQLFDTEGEAAEEDTELDAEGKTGGEDTEP